MSIPDDLIAEYYFLILDVDEDRAKEIEDSVKSGKVNPKDIKLELAKGIVKIFHGKNEAEKAHDNFIKVFSKRELPEEIEELDVSDYLTYEGLDIVNLLVGKKILPSKSEVKRLIEQGGLKLNEEKAVGFKIEVKDGDILKVGKRQFFKIKIK